MTTKVANFCLLFDERIVEKGGINHIFVPSRKLWEAELYHFESLE
jgi:hypothetical protein